MICASLWQHKRKILLNGANDDSGTCMDAEFKTNHIK